MVVDSQEFTSKTDMINKDLIQLCSVLITLSVSSAKQHPLIACDMLIAIGKATLGYRA